MRVAAGHFFLNQQMQLESKHREDDDAIALMRSARVNVGYYAHVESILKQHPPAKWQAIMRSIRENGPAEWFK